MAEENKHWASKYLLDPLNEPDPSDETGIVGMTAKSPPSRKGSTPKHTPTVSVKENSTGGSSNPFRRTSNAKSPSSTRSSNHREEVFIAENNAGLGRERRSVDLPANNAKIQSGHHRRSSSLRERYPGDTSTHPLETLKREQKLAHRSPHLHKRHLPGQDTVDQLDTVGVPGSLYHHEGPYDAASLARNNSYESSPLRALDHTNREALKATPVDKVKDSIDRHRPLDGTAAYPSGESDPLGVKYTYEEGDNMMIVDGGNYKRWPGVDYLPEDIKGKGEPSYSLDKAFKDHNVAQTGEGQDMELEEHPQQRDSQSYADWERSKHRSSGHRLSGELKRRFGSLKKAKDSA